MGEEQKPTPVADSLLYLLCAQCPDPAAKRTEVETAAEYPDLEARYAQITTRANRYLKWRMIVKQWRSPYGVDRRTRRPVDYGSRRAKLMRKLEAKWREWLEKSNVLSMAMTYRDWKKQYG